jgi:CRISPR-associated endonuclease Cas1
MNALWISRIAQYIQTKEALISAQKIIFLKTKSQNNLLRHFHAPIRLLERISSTKTILELLLEEARHAKYFWLQYKKILPQWVNFPGRIQHGYDISNKLLNIGYHHLTGIVKSICRQKDISTVIGLLHVAHSTDSEPLVYDLVELFRSDVVDREVLHFLRQKKKPIKELSSDTIAHFIFKVKKRLEKQFYIKNFEQCETYLYYMDLQVTRFIKAVNHVTIFEPFSISHRHENRCVQEKIDG